MAQNAFFASDLRMHCEDEWTPSRARPQQDGVMNPDKTTTPPASAAATAGGRPLKVLTGIHHRSFVFPDPVAFRYLENDPSVDVIDRRGRLKGYQLYLVEQWACSRRDPTFVLTTYTGDPNDCVIVGVLAVKGDETTWSYKLRTYFSALDKFHARPKETPLGTIMATNLSSFPSALTVIPVPDGDIKKHREDFIVNEDLKRLGCSGRSGLTLAQPAGATQAKFHQLYKTSDRIDLYHAVMELVKLCQVALVIFAKLDPEYADGLLCDVTERAINDWWTDLGTENYNIEPADGILGPTTVAAMLGMLMGARNRLDHCGCPVGKDVFDIPALKRGIQVFQRNNKLERTRRLDRPTLASLRRATAKAAAGEGWAMRKAVKSTVAELSGKGGEMVMGMVGARDKGKIADVETIDIERFIQLAYGDRAKWLWHGKHTRHGGGETFGKMLPESRNLVFSKDEFGGYLWSTKKNEQANAEAEEQQIESAKEPTNNPYSSLPPLSDLSITRSPASDERDQHQRKTVFRHVAGRMSDAKSGLGRIKDAVVRGHPGRQSRDYILAGESESTDYLNSNTATAAPNTTDSAHPGGLNKSFSWNNKPQEYQDGYLKSELNSVPTPRGPQSSLSPYGSKHVLPSFNASAKDGDKPDGHAIEKAPAQYEVDDAHFLAPSAAESLVGDKHFENLPKIDFESDRKLLHHRQSVDGLPSWEQKMHHDAWWPRRLSFSAVVDAVLPWRDINAPTLDETKSEQKYLVEEEDHLFTKLETLQMYLREWVSHKAEEVVAVEGQAIVDNHELRAIHQQLREDYDGARGWSQELLAEERVHLMDRVKSIEGLAAKLEYQINALSSRITDVEDEIMQFEAQVDTLEVQAADLGNLLRREGWRHWIVRTLTGIGSGPHPA